MATFGEEMVDLAQELTLEFSEENGLSTIRRLTGQVYDPDTGTNVPAYSSATAYMVFLSIEEQEAQNADYLMEHEKCIIAGDDLTFEPKRNDLIVKPDTTTHRIVHVKTDQYSAAYILHIERKNA